MAQRYRVPKTFNCIDPECDGVYKERYPGHPKPSGIMVCMTCGDERDVMQLIEHGMRQQGVEPERDWDDNL